MTSLPRALPLGELARQRLRGQARQNKTRKHSDTMSLTNRACIAVLFAFCQHPCPLRHGFAVPPCPLSALACHLPRPGESFLVGEALAFRDVFQQTQIGFIENETSLPRALLLGELSSGCETERLDKGRLSSERNNAGAALYNLSDIFASLDATSPSRGGFGIP